MTEFKISGFWCLSSKEITLNPSKFHFGKKKVSQASCFSDSQKLWGKKSHQQFHIQSYSWKKKQDTEYVSSTKKSFILQELLAQMKGTKKHYTKSMPFMGTTNKSSNVPYLKRSWKSFFWIPNVAQIVITLIWNGDLGTGRIDGTESIIFWRNTLTRKKIKQ